MTREPGQDRGDDTDPVPQPEHRVESPEVRNYYLCIARLKQAIELMTDFISMSTITRPSLIDEYGTRVVEMVNGLNVMVNEMKDLGRRL